MKIISIYSSGESHIWLVHTITCSLIYTMYIHKAHRRVSRLVFCSSCFSSSEPVSIYHSMAKQRNNISTDLFPTSALFKTFYLFLKTIFLEFSLIWSCVLTPYWLGFPISWIKFVSPSFRVTSTKFQQGLQQGHQQSFNNLCHLHTSRPTVLAPCLTLVSYWMYICCIIHLILL